MVSDAIELYAGQTLGPGRLHPPVKRKIADERRSPALIQEGVLDMGPKRKKFLALCAEELEVKRKEWLDLQSLSGCGGRILACVGLMRQAIAGHSLRGFQVMAHCARSCLASGRG